MTTYSQHLCLFLQPPLGFDLRRRSSAQHQHHRITRTYPTEPTQLQLRYPPPSPRDRRLPTPTTCTPCTPPSTIHARRSFSTRGPHPSQLPALLAQRLGQQWPRPTAPRPRRPHQPLLRLHTQARKHAAPDPAVAPTIHLFSSSSGSVWSSRVRPARPRAQREPSSRQRRSRRQR